MTEEIRFLPYETAKKLVAAVMEEEHLHEAGRRVLTVYDAAEKELCWFDAEDVLAEIDQSIKNPDDRKAAAVEHILHHIPEWALDEALKHRPS